MSNAQAAHTDQNHSSITPISYCPEPTSAHEDSPIITTRNLNVTFKNVHALSGVNLQVNPGEILGLLGDNGAGKSTLVETIMGLQKRYSGEIYIQGKQVSQPSVQKLRESGVEIAYQSSALNSCMKVWQNFFMGKEITKQIGPFRFLDKRRMREKTRYFLKKHGLDMPFSVNTPVGKLSGGQRRILSILRAYHFARTLLILDEPTAALSEHEVEIVLNLVRKAKSEGIAVIFITHKEHEVFEIADRFFVLYQGNEYMVISRKYILLNRINSLLISSRVLAVQDIAAEIVQQFSEPLRNMRANAEKLKYDFDVINDRELFDELIDTIMSEIRSLTSVIYHLSHLSDEPQVNREEISIRSLIESIMYEIPHHIRRHVDFDLRVDSELSFNLDRDIIKQVLLNLVVNAIEASEERGLLTISAERDPKRAQSLVILIKDRGKGMDAQTLQEIFNPFFTTKTSNSGLGLSIVYKLLELEDGSIDVCSAPGEGTEFRVYLHR